MYILYSISIYVFGFYIYMCILDSISICVYYTYYILYSISICVYWNLVFLLQMASGISDMLEGIGISGHEPSIANP